MEAGGAVDGSGCTGNTFQLSNLSTFAQGVHDELGSQLGTQNVVRCDLAVNLNTVDSAVNADDTDALCLGSLNGTGDGIGVDGVHDQDADALGDQVLDVGNLLGHVVAGIDHRQLCAQLGSGGLGTLSQGDEEGIVQSGDGQADGTVAHGLDGLSNSGIGLHVPDVDQGDFNGDRGGNRLTGDQLGGVLNGSLTDQSRLLGDGSVHAASLDSLDGIVGGVEANHNDVLARAGNSFHSAQCHLIVGSENALDVAVGLEHILHNGHTLSTVEVCGLLGDHFQLGVCDVVEALAAVDGSGCTGNALQLGDLGTFAQGVHDVLGSQLSTQDVVRSDLAVDLNAVDGTVHRDDADALCLGSFHGAGDGVGVNGVDDQDADALGDQVLDVGNLLGHIVTGVNHGQHQAQVGGSLFSAFDQSDEEGVVLGRNRQADGTGSVALVGLHILFTVNDDAAGGEGQSHGDAQQHRNQFLKVLHCKSSLILSAFCRTERQPG